MPEEAVTPEMEMQKAIVQLAEELKGLREQNAALEAKITAMSAPGKAAAPAPEAKEQSAQDAAYEKVLAELGIRKGLKEGIQ